MLENFVREAVVLFGVAVVVLLLCSRFRLPPLVGLIFTGLLIGPSSLGLISAVEAVELFAEIGVVLLLFVIGVEFSLERLRALRRPFFIGGPLQALLTTSTTALLALALGFSRDQAVFLGFVVTLSSTAILLKLLHDRRESETPQGNVTFGVLIFQDFLIVPMVILTPMLSEAVPTTARELIWRFAGALFAMVLIFATARFLMPRLFHRLAATRMREVFVLAALGVCLAMAWTTHTLGFSLALGAFVAGILISETEYSHQVIADIGPFRDVFSSIFFISMGMLVDVHLAASRLFVVLGLALAIVLVKALAAGVAVRVLGYPLRIAVVAALGLAQIGEFSFVLMDVGRTHGLLTGERFQVLLAAAVLTLLLTPALVRFAPAVAALGLRLLQRPNGQDAPAAARGPSGHVIVIGFGVNGQLLTKVLRETHIPYVIVELSSELVRRATREGEPILYGDATRREILEHAGIVRARVTVFAISDLDALQRSIRIARQLNPEVEIIVRTRAVREIEGLHASGANQVIAQEFETAIEIFTRVLERFHVPRNIIRQQTRLLRGEDYRMLRAQSFSDQVSAALLASLAAGTTDLFLVEAESSAAGKTLRELDLRQRTGVSVIALVRGEKSFPNPSPDLTIEANDTLVLVGSHAQIDLAWSVLGQAE